MTHTKSNAFIGTPTFTANLVNQFIAEYPEKCWNKNPEITIFHSRRLEELNVWQSTHPAGTYTLQHFTHNGELYIGIVEFPEQAVDIKFISGERDIYITVDITPPPMQ